MSKASSNVQQEPRDKHPVPEVALLCNRPWDGGYLTIAPDSYCITKYIQVKSVDCIAFGLADFGRKNDLFW